ncbi:hypothetical protein BCR35DRAFT_311378 [Leucosporidium creatinivorum]|uniref:Salivary gland secretion 1 n=1 Tax=Leucosporidium creatinivorum TaxID=106004 RepID=A0A1Y2C271_9BASI|nr:hypothetical protein BCR35DRAFT_311378 [Leucosporidium creatinivorum]
MVRTTTKVVPPVLALLALVLLFRNREPPEPVTLVEPDPTLDALCDPFAEPGFLHYDPDQPKAAKWIPYSPSCEPAPDWLAAFAAQDKEQLSFLANRTILVLGDSVDRNGLEHLAVMLGLPRYPVPYDDFSKKGFVPPGWDERGIPWVVEVPWLGTTFTNGFMYGLDDEDNFRQQPDWHPPGQAEERVDKLFKVHTDQLPYPPSFISLHSGLWDLAFFGRQDRVSKLSTEIPLTQERIIWWQARMTHLVDHVRETWPGVPVWLRKLHRVGPVGGASYDWRHTGSGDPGAVEKFSNFFTNARIHQIREMQEQVARETGIPAFDFGEIWEGWQSHQQMVHPLLYPGGPVFAQALIHHIWMESVGRDSWRLTRRRPLTAINKVDIDALD